MIPRNLRNASYVSATRRLVRLFHVWRVARMVFICSGSLRSDIFASCLKILVRDAIVASALPFCFMSIAKLIRSSTIRGLYAGAVEKSTGVTEPAKISSSLRGQTCKP